MTYVVLFAVTVAALGGQVHRALVRLSRRHAHDRATARNGTILARPPITSERTDEDGTKRVWQPPA